MAPIVRQAVELPAPPEQLYATYLDGKAHAAVTGAKVVISARPGSRFSAFDGMLAGKTLQALPGRLIVQSWRSVNWRAEDPDSLLLLAFAPGRRRGSGRIDLLQVGVPDHDADGVARGWRAHYWKPWRAHLAGATARR
jgi:activator of HSP90 ATPase